MIMANIIKIRRGNKVNLPPGGTREGELRYSMDTKSLYIDNGVDNILLGGDEAFNAISETIAEAINPENYIIDANDKVLATSSTGLFAKLSLEYIPEEGKINLLGKMESETNEPIVISTINLPVDNYLKHAEVVVDPDDEEPGTYLLLTFNTAEGDNDVYVDLHDLVDVYTSGNNSIIVQQNKIYLKIDANSNLETGSDGLKFKSGFEALSSSFKTSIMNHINDNINNPHNITKATIGLDKVDNTSDSEKIVDGGSF
jgi:hypothetical protein